MRSSLRGAQFLAFEDDSDEAIQFLLADFWIASLALAMTDSFLEEYP
ncbi:MAG: hypothetical protein JSS22_03625 [Proteobacteria bacterium]|nr:hypothetical protein [Pseudomonadota bacterium]